MTKRPFTILMNPWLSPQVRSGRYVPEASDRNLKGAEQHQSPANPQVMRIPAIEPDACDPSGRVPVETPAPTVSALSP